MTDTPKKPPLVLPKGCKRGTGRSYGIVAPVDWHNRSSGGRTSTRPPRARPSGSASARTRRGELRRTRARPPRHPHPRSALWLPRRRQAGAVEEVVMAADRLQTPKGSPHDQRALWKQQKRDRRAGMERPTRRGRAYTLCGQRPAPRPRRQPHQIASTAELRRSALIPHRTGPGMRLDPPAREALATGAATPRRGACPYAFPLPPRCQEAAEGALRQALRPADRADSILRPVAARAQSPPGEGPTCEETDHAQSPSPRPRPRR